MLDRRRSFHDQAPADGEQVDAAPPPQRHVDVRAVDPGPKITRRDPAAPRPAGIDPRACRHERTLPRTRLGAPVDVVSCQDCGARVRVVDLQDTGEQQVSGL